MSTEPTESYEEAHGVDALPATDSPVTDCPPEGATAESELGPSMCARATEEELSATSSPSEQRSSRLYINNVSYQTTESDLYELVKDFKVLSVLIPSHTVRGFKSAKQRSLGIAYVDFATPEEAALAEATIDGKVLNKRPLRVKPFVPYIPNRLIVKSKKRVKKSSPLPVVPHAPLAECAEEVKAELSVDECACIKTKDDEADHGDAQIPVTEDAINKETKLVSKPVSNDTIYIERLSKQTTDGELRELFHDYIPTEVYIFKSRYKKGKEKVFWRRRQYVSALIMLGEKGGLESAIRDLQGKKLHGKHVYLKAAYVSKIEEVKKAAQVQQITLEKVQRESKSVPRSAITGEIDCCDEPCSSCVCKDEACDCQNDNPSPETKDEIGYDEMVLTGTPEEPQN